MTQKAEDLMMGAPNFASAKQLRELNIRTIEPATAKPAIEAVRPE
jgi:aspartyl-tRNA synthetase